MLNPDDNGRDIKAIQFYFDPVILNTESVQDFEALLEVFNKEILPIDFVERMYVRDFVQLVWEIVRLRRFKVALLDRAYPNALAKVLRPILVKPANDSFGLIEALGVSKQKADRLARDYFVSQKAKRRVESLLRNAQLENWVVEAEAYKSCLPEIEQLDRSLTSAEARRDKILRNIALYRESMAKQLRQITQRIVDASEVPASRRRLRIDDGDRTTAGGEPP
jgi:hypothetical protein